jgi:phospholipase C
VTKQSVDIQRRSTLAILLAVAVSGCGRSTLSPFDSAQDDTGRAIASPIDHVVFIIQENRSFNNLFYGYPGAKTAKYGYDTTGQRIKILPRDLGTMWDVGHASSSFFAACDGTGTLPGTDCKMDGWLKEGASGTAPKNPEYTYVPREQIASYWTIASEYVLSDRTFPSNLDGSFVAHQYSVAAYADHAVDFPFGAWGCEGVKGDSVNTLTRKRTYGTPIFPCFDIPTIASEADAAGVSWRFYAGPVDGDGGLWSSYQADKPIYDGSDWKTHVISPPAKFLTDIGKGKLAAVTWITPLFDASDHPGIDATEGPAWVASLVNAVGTSKFWNSSAIFIMWDDWGGLFDPVKPVYEDYDGLGFRVPLMIVSPYSPRDSVTHVQYETASVLRFIEDNFGLGRLAAADKRANDPADDPAAFDYEQTPRTFEKIPGGKSASFWLRDRANDGRAKPANIIGDD